MTYRNEQKELDDPLGTKQDADYQEFGVIGGSNNQDLMASQQEALQMLRESLQTTPQIGVGDALMAGAMEVAPAIGGYFAGRNAGNAYVSPWLKPETILGMDLPGANAGALAGMEAGRKEGDKYLNELKLYQEAERQQKFKVGALELQQSGLESRGQASIAAANARQSQGFQNQKERDTTQFGRDKELVRLRASVDNNGRPQIPLSDALAMSAQSKILQGLQPSPEEATAYSKYVTDPRDAALISNAISRGENVNIRGQGFERAGLQLGLGGYEAEPNPQMLPRPEVIKELQLKSGGLASMQSLLQTYIDSPGDPIIGQTSAQNAALTGMLMNAGRMYTNSGANFTETEQRMLKQALPAIMAGDLMGATKAMALGRDQKTFARDIQGIMQKAFDFQVYGSARYRRQGVPAGYYGDSDWLTPSSSPVGTPGASPTPAPQGESLTDQLKRLRAEKGATNAVQ